jgi:hypothetical protein
MKKVKTDTMAISCLPYITLPTFDISQRSITLNPNIRINPMQEFRHNKQKGNSAILGISIKGHRKTHAEFLEDSYPNVYQPHWYSHFVDDGVSPISQTSKELT